jgi:PAS domain S-box-containing protein
MSIKKPEIVPPHLFFDQVWYKALADISPVGIFFTDAEGHFLNVNRRWCEISGLSPAEAEGNGWLLAVHKEDQENVSALWHASIRNNQPFWAEYRFSSPQGKVTWVVGNARAVLSEDGIVTGHVGTITDIDKSKTQLVALEQLSTRLKTIVEQMPVLLFAFDHQARLCAWNNEAARITGYTASEMIGNPEAMELLCPDPEYRQRMLGLYKSKGDCYRNWEWQLVAKDGEVKDIAFSNISLSHPLEGWANWGVGIEITSLKEAERKLHERVKELTCLYKLSVRSNRPNLDLDEFLQDVVEIIPPAWQYPETTCARIIFKEKIFQSEAFAVSAWRLSSDLNVRGQKVGLIEIYDKKQHPPMADGPFLLEERLLIDEISLQVSRTISHVLVKQDLRLLDELTAKTEELEQFAHTISHDLNTPLAAIAGFAELLNDRLAKGDLGQAHICGERISEITGRMERRINELLKLAKIGKIIEPTDEVEFGEIIDEAINILAQRLSDSSIKVTKDKTFPKVLGDRERLLEVIENLLDNAIKYIGQQPNQVEIGCRSEPGQTVFFVKDNGIGVREKDFDAIFELFKRLDKDSNGDGTGLSIIKRIIEAHGGRIWIESEGLGKGSCFCFTLGHVFSE